LFGIEAIVSDELKRLSMRDVRAENGRVLFSGNERDLARANINLATGERVLIIVGETPAKTFDELFEGVKRMPWEDLIPIDGAFPVKGHSLNSSLHSIPDCQSIIKKATVERLRAKYNVNWFNETGSRYQIQFSIMRDVATLYLDTSGAGLHKRGYRPVSSAAPLRETLAAAIVRLSRYRGRDTVYDPFCGSGTLPIEAALAAVNRAPGVDREFAAQKWVRLPESIWSEARSEARDREYHGKYDIHGGDIDPKCIELSVNNAERAGVSEHIRFSAADAARFSKVSESGLMITNPPYGERVMLPFDVQKLYRDFGSAVLGLDLKMYILSAHTEFESSFGKKAVKKRKLYNGMIKCDLYMYY